MAKDHQERTLNVMHTNPGMQMTISRINEELENLSRNQVTQALYALTEKGLIRRITQGVYVFDGSNHATAEDGHVYETIGCLQDGTAVVRSDDGDLFVLESLEAHFDRNN